VRFARRELVAWALLLVLAAGLRMAWLGARPPHHDEAVHAHFADVLLREGAYRYDPTYHGPLLYYVTAAVFAVAGENLLTLRLYPMLAGIALVALPLALRRRLGRGPAWWCGLILAISPSFLYYSRFARNDVPVALFTAAALVLIARSRDRGSFLLVWAGICLALHAISKETFYVLLPLLVVGGVAAVAIRSPRRALTRLWRWAVDHRTPLLTAGLWFVAICLTAYTFVFIHPADAPFPIRAVRYWYQQHRIQRVGGPWYYHFPRLGLYEFLPLGAALGWVAMRRRRPYRWEAFCFGWGVAGLAMFAYLGEKVPWLEVHQVLPFVPLAGAQLARTFSRHGRWWSRGLAVAALGATAWSAGAVTYAYPTITTSDPHAELLVFVQTTPEAESLAREGLQLARRDPDRTVAAVAGEGSWPLSWQWRNLKVWWGLPRPPLRPPLVVCDPGQAETVAKTVGPGYDERQIPLRGWWVETWTGIGPWQVARWFVTRRPWSPIGATDIVVLEKTDAASSERERGGIP
jgi:uncharacterized protein (TIGR03663 family)